MFAVPVAVKLFTDTVPVKVGDSIFAFEDKSTTAQEADVPFVVKNLPELLVWLGSPPLAETSLTTKAVVAI